MTVEFRDVEDKLDLVIEYSSMVSRRNQRCVQQVTDDSDRDQNKGPSVSDAFHLFYSLVSLDAQLLSQVIGFEKISIHFFP